MLCTEANTETERVCKDLSTAHGRLWETLTVTSSYLPSLPTEHEVRALCVAQQRAARAAPVAVRSP